MKYLIGSIVALVLVFASNVGVYVSQLKDKVAYGSVTIGNEYQATTTDATWSGATATGDCKADVAGGMASSTTLGSIIVTKTSNAILNVYDATTTKSHLNHATTTIASFPLTTVGTYTFDVKLKRGLCVQVDTAVGVASTTITYRP